MDQVKITKSVPLTNAFQTIHTAHFQRYLIVRNLHIVNTSGADATVQVTLTDSGVSPQQSAALLWDFTIPGNDFLEFGEGLTVSPSASISALASANDALVLNLSGVEE